MADSRESVPFEGWGQDAPEAVSFDGWPEVEVAQGFTASGGVVQAPPEVAGQATIIFEAAGGSVSPARRRAWRATPS